MYIDTEKPILLTRHGRVTQNKGYWHNGNILKNHLLIIFTRGRLSMKVADEVFEANSGDALFIHSGTRYAPLESTGCEYYFFHFSTPDSEPNETKFKIGTTNHLPEGEYSISYSFDVSPVIEIRPLTKSIDLRVQNVLDRVSKTNVWQSDTEKLLLDSYLREILILLNTNTSGGNVIDPILRKIVRYINANFKNDISLSTLSSAFDVSQSYIARLFKEHLHTCSVDYINGLRIRYACDLLLNSELSIGEISTKAGFNNQYYFTRVFKRMQGITPTEFRKSRNSFAP